jgi:hypothetical protein
MSWDDIIIGEPNGRKMNSAGGVSHEITTISQNSQSYWCDDCILDLGITIYKDTKEGEHLTGLLNKNVKVNAIQEWLDRLILRKITPSKLLPRIKVIMSNVKNEAYTDGCDDKLEEIQKVLGIRKFY